MQVFVLIYHAAGSPVALIVNVIRKIEFGVASYFLEFVRESIRTTLVKCVVHDMTLVILGGLRL